MENGADIQNTAYGRSGIMMRLRIVKYAMNGAEQKKDEDNIPHGKLFLKELMLPWANTDTIVCTYSYFTSVTTAEE